MQALIAINLGRWYILPFKTEFKAYENAETGSTTVYDVTTRSFLCFTLEVMRKSSVIQPSLEDLTTLRELPEDQDPDLNKFFD